MASKKLSALLEFGAKASASVARATSFTQKKIDRLGDAIKENTKKQASLRAEMKKQVRQGKVTNSTYFKMKEELNGLERSSKRLEHQQRRLRRVNKGVRGSFKAMGKIGINVLRGIGVAAVAAVAGFGKLILSTAAYGDKLAKTARRMGIASSALEKLRFIAERQGVSTEVLEKGLDKLKIALGEAARSANGPYAQAFKKLGINQKKFRALKPEKQIEVLADSMNGLSDKTEQAEVAYLLFGQRGLQMLQITEQGSAGIQALGDEFDKLGGAMGERGTKAAEKFQDKMTNLKQAMSVSLRSLGGEILPQLNTALDRLLGLVRSGDVDFKSLGGSLGHVVDQFTKWAEAATKLSGALDRINTTVDKKLQAIFGKTGTEIINKVGANPLSGGPLTAFAKAPFRAAEGIRKFFTAGTETVPKAPLSPSTGILANGQSASTVTIHQTVNAPPGMSADQLLAAAARQNQQAALASY